ncbi:MAG TPA: glycosyltransferase family 1 protein, partial [Saprospirales bacterium]|nr:glycosyltransferase family 1 protein [Saprospirales bacterium]
MVKKLKIGFDAKRLFHNRTGLGNYSRTLVRNLQRLYPEHEYHLFTPKISQDSEVLYFLDKEKFIIHTCNGNFGSFWRSRGVTKEINAVGMDIYHGLSHEIPLNSHSLDAKTVVTMHDLIFEYYPEQFGLLD